MGQIVLEGGFVVDISIEIRTKTWLSAEELIHRRDFPHIPPGDVTILGSGDGGLRHPILHGRLDVVVSDSGQTCGVVGVGRRKDVVRMLPATRSLLTHRCPV